MHKLALSSQLHNRAPALITMSHAAGDLAGNLRSALCALDYGVCSIVSTVLCFKRPGACSNATQPLTRFKLQECDVKCFAMKIGGFRQALLESKIVSGDAVERIFCKVPAVLQCHRLFQMDLSSAASTWDDEEAIGGTFVASVSWYRKALKPLFL